MKYLDTYEKFYVTHDNGGRPFSVNDNDGRVSIYKEIDFLTDVDKIFTGEDTSSVLLKLKDKYIFVGTKIYEFTTEEEITDFKSPIGNSDVPYPYAVSENYIYFMLDNVFVDKTEIDGPDYYKSFYEKKDSLNLKPFNDVNILEDRLLESLLEKVKDFEIPKVYTEAEIQKRWSKKRGQIKHLSKNIRKFKIKVDKDLSSDDEKTKITATIAKIMEITAERVGNDESSSNGHHGVSNFTKKHIKISGSNVTLKYTGKSGVAHDVTFSHAKVAKNLKELLKKNPKDIFTTSEGQSIKNTQVNNYLSQFNITSKDLRGFKANKLMTKELIKLGKVKEEKDRKTKFNDLLKKVAEEIGHLPTTLKKHYLLPEIERNFYAHGSIGRVQKI